MYSRSGIIAIIIFLIFLFSQITAQKRVISIIKGNITDGESKNPLAAASVYFAATTIGVTADKEGKYSLEVFKPGNYELVISMVGYISQKKYMFIEEGLEYALNFELMPKSTDMNPVEIEGENRDEWKNNLKQFTRMFIGVLTPAKYCTIENKELIDFEWKDDSLCASSKQPLEIRNDFLGYKIICEITRYRYSPKKGYQDYAILTRFVELEPKDKDQKLEWENNRELIYMGSPTHLLWSIRYNRIQKEGFELYLADTMRRGVDLSMEEVAESKDLKNPERFPNKDVFSFSNYLKVMYKGQVSFVKLRYSFFTIDLNGIADNHIPFLCYGYWSNLGLSNMLPRDYYPKSLTK